MKVLVVGGTGTAGRPTVAELARRGHEVRRLGRHDPDGRSSRGDRLVSVRGDVTTGAGLAAAMDGVDAVVDTSNVTTSHEAVATGFFVGAAERLLRAEAVAGVRQHVVLSIVGIDLVPYGYFRAKVAQERAVAAVAGCLGVGWTVLRATQFHEFAGQVIARLRCGPIVPTPLMSMQPVSADDVAEALADAVETGSPPSGRLPDVTGPQEWGLPDMARAVLRARGERALVVPFALPGTAGRAMRNGALRPTSGVPVRIGTTTFEDYLAGVRTGRTTTRPGAGPRPDRS